MNDLISRQAAIATAISGRVRTLPTTEDGEDWIRVNEVRESLLNLPTAEPDMARAIATILENERDMRVIERNAEQRWTPVTEGLPEKSGDYYVTWEAVKGGKRTVVKMRFYQYLGGFGSAINHIIAWMPLPEPWKGEDDAEDDSN